MDNPFVSVIIPTYNSEKTLDKCLRSIKNQTYKNIETIIVDKFSCDDTQHIAKFYNVFLIIVNLGMSAARNKGILESRGKYILSIDSDMELSPTVIEDCLRLITENDNIGGIRILERSVGTSFWVKVRDFERSFYANTDIESARFFIKDLVFEVNGYDEDVTFSEDSTLPQKIEKLGYNVKARVISNILHHENEFSIFKWLKKKYHYGKTGWIYRNKYREYSKKQMNLLYRFGLFLKERRFYSKPILATGVLTLKLLESLSAGLGYIIGRIRNWRKLVKDPIHAFGMFFMKACEFVGGELGFMVNDKSQAPLISTTRRVAQLIEELSGDINLDAGCGEGAYAYCFHGLVVGLDINREQLKKAYERGGYDALLLGSICGLPFQSDVFDLVACVEVIEHLPKSKGKIVLGNLKRISKSLLITTPNRNAWFHILSRIVYGVENPDHVSFWKANELREEGLDVHGCLGLVTARRIPKVCRGLWDILAWVLPEAFGGDLIAIKARSKVGA